MEAFRSGKSSLPPPLPSQPQPSCAGNTSIHAPATSGKNDSVTSAPAPNRKKRRHNKNKRKGGGGVSSVQDFDTNHPICSQCSHGGETNQWTPSTASIASESAAAAAVAAAAANSVSLDVLEGLVSISPAFKCILMVLSEDLGCNAS